MSAQVSVVIPTHNRSAMLRQALRGALSQEDVDVEAIVVDDGSTDDTRGALEVIDDDRLTVLRHEQPQGVSRARNAGIAKAAGEWIAFLDDDDLWAPGKLRAHLDRAAEQGLTLTYSGAVMIDEGMAARRITSPPDGDLPRLLFGGNVIVSPSVVVVRADLIERVGDFDDRLSALADWDLWIRAASAGNLGPVPEPLTAYRIHAQNMAQADALAEFSLLREKHEAAASRAGVDFGHAWRDRLASQDASAGRRFRAAGRYLRRAVRDRNRRDLAWAAITLGGERADRLAQRIVARRTQRPEWLDLYA